ncbi:MAG: Gfo/Idh/MocA family oxidoreductase [Verrucomicrobia bacterium]|nr:Gfo/Idh/MocA family oxidoreductase [Verrucomicrobiota bacterium]
MPPLPLPASRRAFLESLAAGSVAWLLSARARGQAPAERKLGIALCGLGNYARGQLAPALRLTQHCELRGVITGSREKGQAWAREFGFPEKHIYSYATMARLIDNPAIDIVYVVTPNSLHAEHTSAAAWAGKHVICEKPMANSVADCNAMLAACRANRVKLSIGYRLQFEPHYRELKRLAREQDFGPFRKMTGGLAFTIRQRVWRIEKAMAGGGPLMDIGIYCLQAACMAADTSGEAHPTFAPVAVQAREHPKQRPDLFRDVEEGLDWRMEFANGATGEFTTSYNGGMDKFRAEAEKGWYELAPAFQYGGLKVTTSKGPPGVGMPPPSQQAVQIDDFARCVKEGRESPVSGEMGRRDMVIIEAIYRSIAQGGRRVEVKV